jgi:glucose/arabinose dehydrogenase
MNPRSPRPGRLLRSGGALFLLVGIILSTGCSPEALRPAIATQPPLPDIVSTVVDAASQPTPLAAKAMPEQPTTVTPTAVPSPMAPTAPVQRAQALPDPKSASWKVIAGGLSEPVDMAAPHDNSGRLLIVERTGKIRIFSNGQLQPDIFLDVNGLITTTGTEQGLLGMALDPDFNNNGYFYINYTDTHGDTVIARYTRAKDTNKGSPDSAKILIQVAQPYPNHNGGSVRFGPDGYLYLGLGDGGSAGDPKGNAQNPATLLGKILRIDVKNGDPYGIPPGNLFQDGAGRPEVYAMGLRNPWRIAFDPLNGDLYIGDVGQNLWEEIDILTDNSDPSHNFGWNFFEGNHPYKGTPPPNVTLIPPVWEYDHSQGCSVTGGVVYNGTRLPGWQGVYLYADYCSGKVWGLLKGPNGVQSALLYESGASVSSFGEDQGGEVYMLDLTGKIYRLEPNG